MVTPSTTQTRYTYEDYLHLPEDKRYEIIDGALYMVPAPLTYHQKISMKLSNVLFDYVMDNRLGEVFPAPIDVVFAESDIVQPDILYISNENMSILTEANVQGAPDLVVEILSPASLKRDREIKHKLYSRYGVKEYWIVDPGARTMDLFVLQEHRFILHQTFQTQDTFSSVLLPDLRFTLQSVFQ